MYEKGFTLNNKTNPTNISIKPYLLKSADQLTVNTSKLIGWKGTVSDQTVSLPYWSNIQSSYLISLVLWWSSQNFNLRRDGHIAYVTYMSLSHSKLTPLTQPIFLKFWSYVWYELYLYLTVREDISSQIAKHPVFFSF